jgi:hypothetical protein
LSEQLAQRGDVLLDFAVAEDCGTMVNPMLVELRLPFIS